MAAQHDRAVRDAVLATYGATGNVSKAAREHDVPRQSASRWVNAALDGDDPHGAEVLGDAGQRLRTRVLDACQRAMLRSVEVAQERIEREDWAASNDFKSDPAPQYMSSIGQMHREAREAEKLAAERDGEMPVTGARIIFETTPVDDDADES